MTPAIVRLVPRLPGRSRAKGCVLLLPLVLGLGGVDATLGADVAVRVLADFQNTGEGEFPAGWEAQRSKTRAQESYRIERGAEGRFLSAKKADQRVFKRIAWDPRQYPVITWRWRLRSTPPEGTDPIAAVYVSLDTDLFVIPVATKYSWSGRRPKGTTTDGGIFGASEIVIRSEPQPIGKWVEERVNAYEDFKRLHDHEPAPEAWGISVLAGPGVEIDFGPITARPAEQERGPHS